MENKAKHEPSKLSYQYLKQITNDFSKHRILGSGGFGTVYKGVHDNDGKIAVKVLHNISAFDDKEFHKEFDNLSGLEHPNIVELVGFCNESEEVPAMYEGKQVTAERLHLALCFEYVKNGSLSTLISDETRGFTWHTRYKIIKGICEGLKYLREGLEYPIMHFDLKPDNILLDKCMVPKIADFGLSRLFGEENTLKTTSSAGTRGYCPPEYIKHQILSGQFDIFSLGVIIVRIMTGHERYNSVVEMPARKSVKLVHESWRERLRGTMSHTSLQLYCNQVKICIEIALNCLISNRQERPTIQDIVSSLDGTETIIGDQGVQNEQFFQDDAEFTLPSKISSIPINDGPTSDTSAKKFLVVEPTRMSWDLLKEITDDFSEARLLGRGGYGSVYKGVYGDGQVIAVKRLHTIHEDDYRFANEIRAYLRARHENIMQLVGYCSENEERVVRHNAKHVVSSEIHRAVCFEYIGGGSLEQYLSEDMSSGLDWQTLYRIIKGICEGLRYLHEGMESPIIHMSLEPGNIFLDGQMMVPKIVGLDQPRLFMRRMSRMIRAGQTGSLTYMPPEFIDIGVITKGHDIFSLGVLILQLMTGKKTYRELHNMSSGEFIRLAHEKWRERLQKTLHGTSVKLEGYYQQVKKCLEIGIKCRETDRQERPAIEDIIRMLNETEIFVEQLEIDTEDSELLLEVHPLELQFTSLLEVARKKKAAMISSSCSLQLKNKGNDRVAFMLVANSPKRYLTKEPLCGVVPPRCAYTLTLTKRNNNMKQSSSSSSDSGDDIDFFTLYSAGVHEYGLLNVNKDTASEIYSNFFEIAKDEVQEMALKVISDRPAAGQVTSCSELPTRPTIQIITTPDAQQISSVDVHPTEPWIMTTSHVGSLFLWNYHTMAALNSFQSVACAPVNVAKFITREKWLVAGYRDGGILVYNYENEEEENFNAHESCITTLAVHSTSPFVLSSSEDDDHLIKLWDWSNEWECTREFRGHTDRVTQIMFNLENNNHFSSASLDRTVKVWSICSDDSSNIITLKLDECGLCADYFTRHNRQHLIVGCKYRTAQIWNLEMKECVYELEGHEDHISVVGLFPDLPVLVTGSLDGTIRVWDSTTYKLENIISFNLGAIYAFGCIKGSRRIMVGCHQGIAKIEIPLTWKIMGVAEEDSG